MVAKDKQRIHITIHNETKQLMNELLSLHSESFTYSNLIEIALLCYAKLVQSKLDQEAKGEKEDVAKN